MSARRRARSIRKAEGLDRTWTEQSGFLGVLVRFADDLVILCIRRVRAAEEAWRRVGRSWVLWDFS